MHRGRDGRPARRAIAPCGAALCFAAGLSMTGVAAPRAEDGIIAYPPAYPAAYYTARDYDPSIPRPDSVLGFPLGSRPVRHDEVWRYLDALDAASPRVAVREHGRTHEGRRLGHVILASPQNHGRLEEIRADLAALADPRRTGKGEAEAIIARVPAACWMLYSVHGDELSSTDAALALCYHLAASRDSDVRELLERLVVLVDPLQNPDGRERFLAMTTQWTPAVTNPDYQAMHHAGVWPWGRGNHYLFDLNRDWFMLLQPETRGRVEALLGWNPQLVVDSHEMSALDTYLFSPPREPFNPHMTESLVRWWQEFARDQAAAFDRHGWSYYSGEWNEEWFPGYLSSWSVYAGAVGVLYEQAGVNGSLVRRQDGTLLTYAESVHHQLVSSLANLATAARNQRQLLGDFYREKARAVESGGRGPVRAFVIDPGPHADRAARLAWVLETQGIEVGVFRSPARAGDLHDMWGGEGGAREFPAGTLVVNLAQPMSPLARAILEFDPRMDTAFLQTERRELEKRKESRFYDVSAWSLPLAYGLEAYWTGQDPRWPVERFRRTESATRPGALLGPRDGYGFAFDGTSDASLRALAAVLQQGCEARVAAKEFTIEGRRFPRGSFLLRRHENPADLARILERAAVESGAEVVGVAGAKAANGPDLGGGEFFLLDAPRTAILCGSPVSGASFGALWWTLEQELALRVSPLDVNQLGDADLSKYNVLVLPSVGGGSAGGLGRVLGGDGKEKIRTWVEAGGTFIATGGGAAFAADSTTGLASTRLRQQALGELEVYARAVDREARAGRGALDSLALWDNAEAREDGKKAGAAVSPAAAAPKPEAAVVAEEEEIARLYMPRGAMLRADLDPEHWLAYGMGERAAVTVFTSSAFLARTPVETPARFAAADSLRVAGLLWPEARERWARTAYATREGKGKGQIILFAGEPHFRGYSLGSRRMLLNAILLGPGLGTQRVPPW